jgi:hypothetical protein
MGSKIVVLEDSSSRVSARGKALSRLASSSQSSASHPTKEATALLTRAE